LDKAKSQLPQTMADNIKTATWIVTQGDRQLTREQKIERAKDAGPGGGLGLGMDDGALIVKLDGGKTTIESKRGKSTSEAKWLNEGKTLEITIASDFITPNGDHRLVTTEEHWELADGGKSLTVHRKTESRVGQPGPGRMRYGAIALEESTWVFTKK
jgi:hypothetical protein